MGRRGKRSKQLPDEIKEKRAYCKLKEEALYRALWRMGLRRSYGDVIKQINQQIAKPATKPHNTNVRR
jgi:hypothetical protein